MKVVLSTQTVNLVGFNFTAKLKFMLGEKVINCGCDQTKRTSFFKAIFKFFP